MKGITAKDVGLDSEELSSSSDDEEHDDDEVMGQKQEGLKTFDGSTEECKLVLVARTDLGMGKGTLSPITPFPLVR